MSQVFTAPLNIEERTGEYVELPVAAGVHLYPGTLLALVTSTGFVTYAGDVAGQIVLGRCEEDVDNTADGVGGALTVKIKRAVFGYAPSSRSSAAYAPTEANVGQLVYVEDEGTVQVLAGSTHKIVAGLFLGLNPDTGAAMVDVRVGTFSGAAEGLALTQNAITDSSTGTPAAPVAGVRTIAAVTSVGTAANAISDLAAELNLVKADIAALKAAL